MNPTQPNIQISRAWNTLVRTEKEEISHLDIADSGEILDDISELEGQGHEGTDAEGDPGRESLNMTIFRNKRVTLVSIQKAIQEMKTDRYVGI